MILKSSKNMGFTLIEVLISVSILSTIILGVFSGISNSVKSIVATKSYTQAMYAARSLMNDFILSNMRGANIEQKPVYEELDKFKYSRRTDKYVNPLLGPLDAKKTVITIYWLEKGHNRKYNVSYIYPSK